MARLQQFAGLGFLDGDSWAGIIGLLDGDDFGELLFVRGGRGELLYTFLSTEDTEGHGELQQLFCPRRTGILGLLDGDDFGELLFVRGGRGELLYTFLSTEDTEGHGELQQLFCPRRTGIFGLLDGDDFWGTLCLVRGGGRLRRGRFWSGEGGGWGRSSRGRAAAEGSFVELGGERQGARGYQAS